jgi:hypothetical protein
MVIDLQFGIYPEYAHLFPVVQRLLGELGNPPVPGDLDHRLRVAIPGRSATSAALSVKCASTPAR